MSQHPEIIAASYTVWIAPVGTAFPAIDAAPAEAWAVLGSNGDRNYSGAGLTVSHQRQYAKSVPAGETADAAVMIETEELRLSGELVDVTLEQYALVLGGNAVATVAAAPGVPGTKTLGLSVRTGLSREFALLVRGPSPYDETLLMQYELPRCCEAGGPQLTYRRAVATGIAFSIKVLPDAAATSEETRFGRVVAQFAAAEPPPPPPPLTVIAADGWQATVASPTDLSLAAFTVLRAGFDETGAAATIADTLKLTKRVRQSFPDFALFTADKVAVSDYIYAADSIPGATNNSTVTSPKPIATWGMADRTLVGNSIAWEIIPFHRDARQGRQVACVRVRATDGTNFTAWQAVSTVTLSSSCETPFQPEVYAGTLDITGLNDDSMITLQGEVYPWFGVAGSVLASNTETEARFKNRIFYKNVARAAAPNIICVASTGNDATGVVSTSEATAAATPCLTVGGAIARASAVLGTGSRNILSGLEIRLLDGVNIGALGFVFVNMDAAGIKVTRASTASRAAAVLTMNASINPFGAGNSFGALQAGECAILLEDITFTMAGAFELQGYAPPNLSVIFRNVATPFGAFSHSSGLKSNSHLSIFGMVATGNTPLGPTSSGDNRIIRGLSCTDYNGGPIDGMTVIGCSVGNARIDNSRAERGALIYNNFLPNAPAANAAVSVSASSAGADMAGVAIVQNLVPHIKTSGDAGLFMSADSANGDIRHLVCHHNTFTGEEGLGRYNVAYDDTPGVKRDHILISFKGNNVPQLNTKGDIFMSDGAKTGNFAFHHGVGCQGTFAEDFDSSGGGLSFGQAYAGIGSIINGGTPLFTDDRSATLPGPVAGSTGGTYTLQAGSPARDRFDQYLLARDLAGTARAATGTIDAGAYA